MTATYTGEPATVPVDAVRLYLGDTTSPFLLTDEEIEFFLTTADDDALGAAALGAGGLAARFAGLVDSTVGDVSKSYSQRAKGYADLAARLAGDVATASAGGSVPVPWAGGLSYAELATNDADGDLVPSYFFEGMDSRPGTTDRRDWY